MESLRQAPRFDEARHRKEFVELAEAGRAKVRTAGAAYRPARGDMLLGVDPAGVKAG